MHQTLQLIYGGVTSREIGCFHNGEYNFSRDINAAYIISQSLSTQLIGQTIINTQSSMVMLTQQQHITVLVSPQCIHYISKSFTQLQSLHAASLLLHAGSTIQSPMQSSSRSLQAASSTQHVCSLLHAGSGRCTASRCSGFGEKNLSLQRSPI